MEAPPLAAPVCASLGAMGSLLGKMKLLVPPDGMRLSKGVKDRMLLLKGDLEEVAAYLADLSELEDPPPTAKRWMREVRELSYDIEDYIDCCLLRPGHTYAMTRFVCRISHVKVARLPKRLKRYQQMGKMVSAFRIYVQEAIERHGRYELHCCNHRRRYVSFGPMPPTPYEQEDASHLAINDWVREFIKRLTDDGDQKLKVVSVVGSAGIGKTTLAKLLYNRIRGQFDCRAFIRVSQRPDMKRIFHDMLSQVQQKQPPDDYKELALIDSIREYLRDKRYLIIFDDLWATSVWDLINQAFPEVIQRSRIIITTQIEAVALTCCCYDAEYIFEMRPMDDEHSTMLFLHRLFGSESDCPQQFREVSNKIIQICGGLPLATINLASLLASQPVMLMDLCLYICDSLSSAFRTNSSIDRIWQVLNLSYNNLPHYLKTCLLHLNMYPEGYKIYKDDFVKRWVAEGFIDQIEGRDLEKVAESYFDELVGRRFLQLSGLNYNNEVSTCTIHDVVRDLIAYKSVEENFVVVLDCYRKDVELSDKVRRLSLHFSDAKYAKIPTNIRTSEIRSLTIFGLCKCMPSLTNFKLLRVLYLQLSGHDGDELLDLTGICELFQLRYLKVACDIRTELPNQMRGLKYLETLQMDTTLAAVPWDIIFLPCLLHLHLPFDTNLMDLIGRMTPPITLGLLEPSGSNSSTSGGIISNLNNLRDIHLTFCTLPSKYLERNMEILGSLLGRLGNLKTLTLVSASSQKNNMVSGAPEVNISWDGLAPPPLLQKFEWLLHSCIFPRVPRWIGELGNLCILKIAVSELPKNSIDILRGLPTLTALSLNVHTIPVERIVFDKMGFSNLKYFKFSCSVPWLKFEAGAMPNLRKLKLSFNVLGEDQCGTKPISIGYLSGLKEISVKIRGAGADIESLLTTAVINHPSNPRINARLVDWTSYGEEGRRMVTKDKDHGSQEEQNEILKENFDKYSRTQDKESREDENKQVGSIVTVAQGQEHTIVEKHDEHVQEQVGSIVSMWRRLNKQPDIRISASPVSSRHQNLDIAQILEEAQQRWLRPTEICEILRNYRKFNIASEPPNKPPSGSLFMFDRKVLRYFRKDGHNWRKKKDGKTVKQAHERVKSGDIDVLHCYYAHGEENENFQRRTYWILETDFMHIVLVHYLETKVKLKELENAILGPELDIAYDSPESALQPNIMATPENWRQLLGINTGDLKQVIMACGKAVAENDVRLTELLISELGQLVSVSGDPLQRLGAYMLEGLVARLSSSGSMLYKSLKCKEPTSSELMSYMHLLYEICPFYKFGYLSANGAIAEAIKGENFVHIIDFPIALGSQWVTLIQALAARPGGPPCLRITGIDDLNSAYARGGGLDIVGMRLYKVAQSCGLPFEFNAVPAASHEVYLEHLDIRHGEVIVVNFAFQLHHTPDESVSTENHRDRILRMVKSLSPRVVTLVERELNTNTRPFFPRYLETLDYYTAMFESIDIALPRDDKSRMSAEQHCVARDIVNLIACEGAEMVERHEMFGKWKARFTMAGFRPYPLSSMVNNTIKTLLQTYNSFYRLEERDGILYLGWKNRVLVVSSAWC